MPKKKLPTQLNTDRLFDRLKFLETIEVGDKFKTSGKQWEIVAIHKHHCICTCGLWQESFQHITIWLIKNNLYLEV